MEIQNGIGHSLKYTMKSHYSMVETIQCQTCLHCQEIFIENKYPLGWLHIN